MVLDGSFVLCSIGNFMSEEIFLGLWYIVLGKFECCKCKVNCIMCGY